MPFALLFAAMGYGLLITLFTTGTFVPPSSSLIPAGSESTRILKTGYLAVPLEQVLDQQLWLRSGWQPTAVGYSGIGYLDAPATFRVTVENPSPVATQTWAVVAAPYLDRIRPAIAASDGTFTRLPDMGDLYPFSNRIIELPQWIWPITLPPGRSTLLFEITNTGPTLLPLSITSPDRVISTSSKAFIWKALILGVLIFALLFNLSMVVRLKRPGLAWLSVLMLCIIHTQLVMTGFGLWLLWPTLPALNVLLNVSLPLSLISLCQFTPHFMAISGTARRALNAISVLAAACLLAIPAHLPIPGQGSFLLLAMIGGMVLTGVVLEQFNAHVYARYYGISLFAMLIGGLISIFRTVGWVPVNSLTDSSFFLGSAIASLILTSGVGRQILSERKKRMRSEIRVRQEQQLRTRIEQDYNRLLKTHRVTGKPNRSMLEEALNALDSRQQPYTVAFLHLKRFDDIEQALGYRMAEDLLRNYLRHLNRILKRSLGERLIPINGYALASIDTTSHAFAFFRNDQTGKDQALANELMHWFSEQYRAGRFSFSWGVSVGIAHAPEHGVNSADILSSASIAASDIRRALTVYDPAIARRQYQQQILMLDVEKALQTCDIWLEYQPKVSIRDTRVHSAEALIRWQHPEFGKVSPDQWIPLAEQVGMIHLVTRWVIEQVCHDFRRLQSLYGDGVTIAVNISAKDLSRPAFPEEITTILNRYNMMPANLVLEITETAVMADAAAACQMIRLLSESGFRIALDDFGTGNSSLAALATFELDELKIDRSFLQGILLHPTRQRIFRAALELGEALDLDVVVEGVEDENIAIWLQQFPGLHGQGYYWGRPARLPPES
jgi:EAL domain-containing protein (putative c-di-GMP-specific phosphodiesterase class I)